jgi:hypothetical protein
MSETSTTYFSPLATADLSLLVRKGGDVMTEASGSKKKRYNLELPGELYGQLQDLAKKQDTTVTDLLRRFIKLGLIATAVAEDPNGAVIFRQGDKEKEIVLL